MYDVNKWDLETVACEDHTVTLHFPSYSFQKVIQVAEGQDFTYRNKLYRATCNGCLDNPLKLPQFRSFSIRPAYPPEIRFLECKGLVWQRKSGAWDRNKFGCDCKTRGNRTSHVHLLWRHEGSYSHEKRYSAKFSSASIEVRGVEGCREDRCEACARIECCSNRV